MIARNVDGLAATGGRAAAAPTAAAASAPVAPRAAPPTVWGCDPVQLHDRYWAHRGVQVVRPGGEAPIAVQAQLYLLIDENVLATVESGERLETLYWSSPDLVYVRVHDTRDAGRRERVVTDAADRFVRFERIYERPAARRTRAAFTPDRRLAQAWRDGGADWPTLRKRVPRAGRSTIALRGTMYDRASDAELARLARDLARLWSGPGATIGRARALAPGVWADQDVVGEVGEGARATFVGPVWVGAGRQTTLADPQTTLVGPMILWDDPAARPELPPIVWPAERHVDLPPRRTGARAREGRPVHEATKRAFDVAFSIVAIVLTLPLYPLVFLAIWLEDGRPFFFAHRRETRGGREFACLKFRTMYRDAERMQRELSHKNLADGPQFFMAQDVRVTRVGRFLRRSGIDELPQFFNVLLGQMSVVGPRPSPFKENQFCPAWREARLSVRPGITGLWQIRRTRRPGHDFQEWIKYDIEYVERAGALLDAVIIVRTVGHLVGIFMPWRWLWGRGG